MNKMNKILLLLVVGIIIFLFTNNQTCMNENFSNICWSLQSSYRDDILMQNKTLIINLGLSEYINQIIDPFVKSQLIDKKITLEKYLTDKKIPAIKIANAINLINTILNNNCMISSLVEYDIKGTTLLINIVSTWSMDNLKNSMLCVLNDKTVIDDLIKQLIFVIVSPRIELCNKDKFQKYCENSYQDYVKEITPKIEVVTEVKAVPNVVSKAVPNVVSKAVPNVVSKAVPNVVSKAVPNVVSKAVPNVVSKAVPNVVSKAVPNVIPKVKTEVKAISKVKTEVKAISKVKTEVKAIPKVKTEVKAVINKKKLEKFTNELDKTKKEIQTGSIQILNMESKLLPLVSNSPKYMDINSLTVYLQTFNAKSFGIDLEPNMIKIMSIFKTNNKKDLNIIDKKEFGKLVVILVDEIKLIIKKIEDEDDFSKMKLLVDEFYNFQKIYYMLKHNYKLLLVHELIDKNIQKDDERLQAQLCCSKTGEKSCFNFSTNPKNSSAIIYGFNELGYVNTIKCIKEDESSKKLDKEQSMTINELFDNKYAMWKDLTKESKLKILANIVNLFEIFGVKLDKIDGKISDLRKQMEENKNKITISDLSLIVPIKPGNINQKFIVNNNNFKTIVEQIKKADKIDKIQEIIKSLGFTSDQILFNANVNLVYAKDITESFVLVNEIMKNFDYKNNSLVIAKIFGIVGTQESFAEIMSKTTILPRYHQLIVEFILKLITDKKIAIIRSHTMNSVPETTIQYLQPKPSEKDLNLCSNYDEILMQLRKDRLISNNEFNQYYHQINLYCNPNKVKISEITSNKIPINDKKGLAVIDRNYKSYNDFAKEHKEIEKNNLNSEIISDNILFNLMKNTYK